VAFYLLLVGAYPSSVDLVVAALNKSSMIGVGGRPPSVLEQFVLFI
jgi:hypothetical protein